MNQSVRRRAWIRVAFWVSLVVVAALTFSQRYALLHVLTRKKVYVEGISESLSAAGNATAGTIVDAERPTRGYVHYHRWSRHRIYHGEAVYWYVENGYKKSEALYDDGNPVRLTVWNFDGSIAYQQDYRNGLFRNWSPWWWGAEPQTGPTAYWLEE